MECKQKSCMWIVPSVGNLYQHQLCGKSLTIRLHVIRLPMLQSKDKGKSSWRKSKRKAKKISLSKSAFQKLRIRFALNSDSCLRIAYKRRHKYCDNRKSSHLSHEEFYFAIFTVVIDKTNANNNVGSIFRQPILCNNFHNERQMRIVFEPLPNFLSFEQKNHKFFI